MREVAQDVDHAGGILRALPLRPRRAEQYADGVAIGIGTLTSLAASRSSGLLGEVNGEAWLGSP